MKKIILIIALSGCIMLARAAEPYAIISGEIEELTDNDIVTLTTDAYGDPGFTGLAVREVQPIKNHRFAFRVPAGTEPLRFNLAFKNKINPLQDFNRYARMALRGYYLVSGDSLVIRKEGDSLVFTGNHPEKYRIYQQMRQLIRQSSEASPTGPEKIVQQFAQRDELTRTLLGMLEQNKGKLATDLYILYRSEALTAYFGKGSLLYAMTDSTRRIAVKELKGYNSPDIIPAEDLRLFNQSPILKYADLYTKSMFWQYQLDSCYKTFRPFSLPAYCGYINQHFTGLLRERLITNIIFERRTDPLDMTMLVAESLQTTTDEDLKKILLALRSQRVPGATAYDFELVDTNGKLHRLSNYRGKTVLLDFWYTGCGNCIKVQPYLQKIESEMRQKPVVFLSVNVDKSQTQWLKSVASGKYTGPEVVNLYTGGLQLQHPVCRYFAVDTYPTLILVDPKGRLMRNPEDPRKDEGKDLEELITRSF